MSRAAPKVPSDDHAGTDKPPFDFRALRNALGCFATGGTFITAAGEDDVVVGLTANSFSSVSLNPALVSWSLADHAASLPVFQNCSHYAIHVLHRGQEDLAMKFSQSRDDKFDGLDIVSGLGRAPILSDALATFQCANAYRHMGGAHVLFLGAMDEFSTQPGEPLIFHSGKFGQLQCEKSE